MSIRLPILMDELVAPPQKAKTKARRPRGQYRPRIAQTVKWAMEDSLEIAMKMQKIMREMMFWLEEEKELTTSEVAELAVYGVAKDRGELVAAKRLARLGDFDHLVADLALETLALEVKIRPVVDKARTSIEPPPRGPNSQ